MASAARSVLVGEPVGAEMQIDARRGDRPVTGLGLQRLDRHARFAQPGEAGVAQLVTGAVHEIGTSSRVG